MRKITIMLTAFISMTILGVKTLSAQPKIPGCRIPSGTASDLYVEPKTPVAASLGRYGDCPVSYFTGRPNISIPIYTLKVRNVELPITLDYDAGGVLVNCLPGWAGQNWTLNAGGVITRTVKGMPDEYYYPVDAGQSFKDFKNYFSSCGTLTRMWSDGNTDAIKEFVEFAKGDFAPDIYTFHFLGKSGRFFLDSQGKWRVESDDNLEVSFDYKDRNKLIPPLFAEYPGRSTPQPGTIPGFTIRDDEGNVYQFGYDRNAIEYSTNFWQMTMNQKEYESWHASSWYLTKVTDRFGNELFKLDYERGAYVIQMFFSYYSNAIGADNGESFFNDYLNTYNSNGRDGSNFPYTISISSPVYLTSIKGAGVSVNTVSSYFPDSMSTDKLYDSFCRRYDYITSNMYLDLCKRANNYDSNDGNKVSQEPYYFYYLMATGDSLLRFRYQNKNVEKINYDLLGCARLKKLDYITVNAGNERCYHLNHRFIQKRLCLDGISLMKGSGTDQHGIIFEYKFKYNDFDKLPSDYLTTAVDHWGFYNGKEYIDPISWQCKNGTDLNKVREPDKKCSQYGILSEIQYPTGGITDFFYEQNTYGKCQSDNRSYVSNKDGYGGGLRIKSMCDYDSPNKSNMLREVRYSYVNPDGTSSGELFAIPKYSWSLQMPCEDRTTVNKSIRQSSTLVPLANSTGPSLGYSYVTESIIDRDEGKGVIKKNVYRYSNLSDPGMLDQREDALYGNYPPSTPYDEFSEVGFKRGKLLSVNTYDSVGCLMSSKEFEYRKDNILGSHFTLTSNISAESHGAYYTTHFMGGVYKLYYPKYDVVSETERTRTSGGEFQTKVTRYDKRDYKVGFDSAEIRKCISVTTSHSKGSKVLESIENKYSYSLQEPTFINDFYFPTTKTETYWNGNKTKTNIIYYSMRNFRNGYHMVPGLETEGTGSSLPYMGNDHFGYTVASYDEYNANGDLTRFTLPGMTPTYLTWDKYGRLVTKRTGQQTTNYSYNSEGNLVGINNPSGHLTRYGYDSFGRLSQARDTLGIMQRIDYSYRNHQFTDSNISDEPVVPDTAQAALTKDETCTVSVSASMSQTSIQKKFKIEWQQNVSISVNITTHRQTTSIMAGVRKVSKNGTDINDKFTSSGKDSNVDKTYTVSLAPGIYQIAVQMPHYDGDSSTSAAISANYKVYDDR